MGVWSAIVPRRGSESRRRAPLESAESARGSPAFAGKGERRGAGEFFGGGWPSGRSGLAGFGLSATHADVPLAFDFPPAISLTASTPSSDTAPFDMLLSPGPPPGLCGPSCHLVLPLQLRAPLRSHAPPLSSGGAPMPFLSISALLSPSPVPPHRSSVPRWARAAYHPVRGCDGVPSLDTRCAARPRAHVIPHSSLATSARETRADARCALNLRPSGWSPALQLSAHKRSSAAPSFLSYGPVMASAPSTADAVRLSRDLQQ